MLFRIFICIVLVAVVAAKYGVSLNKLRKHDSAAAFNQLAAKASKFAKTAKHSHNDRHLGVKGNGVSYLVHNMFASYRNQSHTCDPNVVGPPNRRGALALSKAGACQNNDDGSGSIRMTGCSGDLVFADYFLEMNCGGNPEFSFDYPLEACRIDVHGDMNDQEMYQSMKCHAKYPFKNLSGILHSTFRNTEECLKNNHPDVFNFVPVQTCLDDGIFIESCKGNVVEVSEFGNNECSGPKPSHMGKKRFYPNSNDVCHGIEDGHQTNQPFSMKCANNHLYKH